MMEKDLSLEEGFSLGKELPFLYQRGFSDLYIGPNKKDLGVDSLQSALELRFFSERKEIRFFLRDKEWKAVEISQEDEVIYSVHSIQNKIYGKTITLKKFLDYDEDGQCYVKATTLSGWEG